MVQAFFRWLVNAEAQISSKISPCGILRWVKFLWDKFLISSIFPYHYHYANAPYTFFILLLKVYVVLANYRVVNNRSLLDMRNV